MKVMGKKNSEYEVEKNVNLILPPFFQAHTNLLFILSTFMTQKVGCLAS